MTARDSEGSMILAACSKIKNRTSAEEAEAKAALFGLQQLANRGIQKLVLELDCSSVAAALSSPLEDMSCLWDTYREARRILASFEQHSIRNIRRESNTVADTLAKFGNYASFSPSEKPLPHSLQNLVILDSCADGVF